MYYKTRFYFLILHRVRLKKSNFDINAIDFAFRPRVLFPLVDATVFIATRTAKCIYALLNFPRVFCFPPFCHLPRLSVRMFYGCRSKAKHLYYPVMTTTSTLGVLDGDGTAEQTHIEQPSPVYTRAQ